MVPKTTTFLLTTDADVATDGDWFAIPDNGRTHIPVSITLSSGTATWVIQGRNSPADTPYDLDTGTASEAISVVRFAQMRVILTAAANAAFVATSDKPMREV